jgi:sugar phosphate isomerase/epimerase
VILCSSGAFSPPGVADTTIIASIGPVLPIDGVEVLVQPNWVGQLDRAASELCRTGLRFPVVHARKHLGAELPETTAVRELMETLQFAKTIGAHLMVLHPWDLPESDDGFGQRLGPLREAADMAERASVRIGLETVPCLRATPLGNLQTALEMEPRFGVVLDTEFLAMHDELEAALESDWLWERGGAVHIHLKDFDGSGRGADGRRRYLDIGEGAIDFQGFFAGLERRGFAGSVALEAPAYLADGRADVMRLQRSLGRVGRAPWQFAAGR